MRVKFVRLLVTKNLIIMIFAYILFIYKNLLIFFCLKSFSYNSKNGFVSREHFGNKLVLDKKYYIILLSKIEKLLVKEEANDKI